MGFSIGIGALAAMPDATACVTDVDSVISSAKSLFH